MLVNQMTQKQLNLHFKRESQILGIKLSNQFTRNERKYGATQAIKIMHDSYNKQITKLAKQYSMELTEDFIELNATKMLAQRNIQFDFDNNINKKVNNSIAKKGTKTALNGQIRSFITAESNIMVNKIPINTGQLYGEEMHHKITKTWKHGGSGDPRSSHESYAGTTIGVNEMFDVDGQEIEGPGLFGDPAQDRWCSCYITMIDRR